jgi:hypothetical protein
MKTRLFKLFLFPVLALAIAQGCERYEAPLVPRDPMYSAAPQHALHKVHDRRGQQSSNAASALIGRDGGMVQLGAHRLIVPAGAVDHPTRFSMRLADNGYVEVDLNASSYTAKGSKNDAGRRGFARPVTLRLSYEEADLADGSSDVVIAWVKPDGSLQPLQSTRDERAHTISAELNHFSPYALASN